jgi:hypothetical protein
VYERNNCSDEKTDYNSVKKSTFSTDNYNMFTKEAKGAGTGEMKF